MQPRVLIVEPDTQLREKMAARAEWFAHVRAEGDFARARSRLLSNRYDWIIVNLRLKDFNGLHLLHLAAAAGLEIRTLVYADPRDASLAREAQRFGTFYELQRGVHRALPAYLRNIVPPADRRNAEAHDRRSDQRAGRRCSDAAASGTELADRSTFPWTQPLRVH